MALTGTTLRVAKIGAATLLVLDVVTLAAFSVHVETRTTTTTTTRPAATPRPVAAVVVPTTSPLPAPVPVAAALQPGVGAPLTTTGPAPHTHPTAGPAHPAHPAASSGSSPTATPSAAATGSGAGTTARTMAACPLQLTDADASGGLQSVVDFAPAFGPFAPEAFAAAAAYQPVLELIGPLLAQYPQLEPVIGPYAQQFVSIASQATALLGSLLQPITGPYENQFVTAETQLAAQLAPYSESLAYSPLGGCVVELENTLVAAGQKS